MEEKHFIREGPKLKYADIKKVEAEIGRDIPTDYIDFLMLHNGGNPEHCNFLDPETDRLDSAELFYGLGETFDLGVQREYASRMPKELMPIAYSGGCQICICTEGENFGRIFLWDSEEEMPEVEQPYYGLLSPAESRELYQQIYSSVSYYAECADTGGWFEERDFNKDTGYGRITYFHELKGKHVKRYKRLLETPLQENMSAGERDRYFMNIVPRVLSIEGGVVLTNHGHRYWDVLVVGGEMAGTVWQVDGCAGQSMRAQPDGFYERGKLVLGAKQASGFLAYMERWVDQALEECKSIYHNKTHGEIKP